MKTTTKLIFALGLLLGCGVAAAAEFDTVKEKLKTAMQAPDRPQEDVRRDENRMPVETLEFLGLRDDMRVVELIPGGGWYTRLLAPVLRDNGDFYIAYGTAGTARELAGRRPFDRVQVLAGDSNLHRPEGSRHYVVEEPDLGIRDVDMVLTFRNYHNFPTDNRIRMNEAVYEALKPGGIYGVVDHTRRHMQPDDPENRRRVDPVRAILEIQEAGFELVDYADLHYRADDELRYEVGRHTVTGNTDRFTLKFRKPQE